LQALATGPSSSSAWGRAGGSRGNGPAVRRGRPGRPGRPRGAVASARKYLAAHGVDASSPEGQAPWRSGSAERASGPARPLRTMRTCWSSRRAN